MNEVFESLAVPALQSLRVYGVDGKLAAEVIADNLVKLDWDVIRTLAHETTPNVYNMHAVGLCQLLIEAKRQGAESAKEQKQ